MNCHDLLRSAPIETLDEETKICLLYIFLFFRSDSHVTTLLIPAIFQSAPCYVTETMHVTDQISCAHIHHPCMIGLIESGVTTFRIVWRECNVNTK